MPKAIWEVNYTTVNIYFLRHVILQKSGGWKVSFCSFITLYFPGKPNNNINKIMINPVFSDVFHNYGKFEKCDFLSS